LASRLRREWSFQGGLILMTSSEDPLVQEASLVAGVDVFLPKPLTAASMVAALQTVAQIYSPIEDIASGESAA